MCRAQTRADVLATVAALALLLAILVPALNAATSNSRDEVCLSNLRQLGMAVSLYTDQYNGTLPGRLHIVLPKGVAASSYTEPYRRRYLPYLLRDVLGEGFSDRLVSCPVAAGINPDSNFELFYQQTSRNVLPTHYALNNYGSDDGSGPTNEVRATNPPYYFGYSSPIVNWPDERFPPQRQGAIANPAREWMIADAWYRDRSNPAFAELQQEGPFQSAWTGDALPHFAPHNTRVKSYRFIDSATRATEAAQIRTARLDGETNTLYFDGHAAAAPSRTLVINGFELLYGFRGTVNPYTAYPQMANAVWR